MTRPRIAQWKAVKFTSSTKSDDEDPSPKRQRVTRHQGHNPLNYDTRLHPLDEYFRPAHFAKVNKEYGRATQDPEHSVTSDENIDVNNDEKHDEASRASQKAVSDMNKHDDADKEKNLAKPFRNTKRNSTPPLPSPNRRRSSRTLGRSEMPNYDMKIHPDYDRVHRPAMIKAASRRQSEEHQSRQQSTETDTASILVSNDSTAQSFAIDRKDGLHQDAAATILTFSEVQAIAIPPLSKSNQGRSPKGKRQTTPPPRAGTGPLRAPSAKDEGPLRPLQKSRKASSLSKKGCSSNTCDRVTAIDFDDMKSFDSRLYRLQNGAPAHGDTLPKTWDYVKQILFDNGEISLDTLNSPDGTDWIKARYEEVRLRIEAFWSSKAEPANNRDWASRHMESFSVFDQKRESKYWRHYEDRLYSPISTSWRELGQVAETDDDEETHNMIDDSHGRIQHGTNDMGTSPWIVGTDEVASGASSRFHASAREEPISSSGDGDREQGYIELEDGDEEQSDVDPNRVLADRMRDTVQPSDALIGTQELTELLSSITKHLAEGQGNGDATGSVTDIVLSDPASSESTGLQAVDNHPVSPTLASSKANVIRRRRASKSPSKLLEAFHYVKETLASATDETELGQYIDEPQASTIAIRGKKRKSRREKEVAIQEDLPDRKAVTQISKSPKTDLPKENLGEDEESADEYSTIST